jgi:hypothetical protein
MAGAWIKVRHDLIDAPEVRRIARPRPWTATRSTAS